MGWTAPADTVIQDSGVMAIYTPVIQFINMLGMLTRIKAVVLACPKSMAAQAEVIGGCGRQCATEPIRGGYSAVATDIGTGLRPGTVSCPTAFGVVSRQKTEFGRIVGNSAGPIKVGQGISAAPLMAGATIGSSGSKPNMHAVLAGPIGLGRAGIHSVGGGAVAGGTAGGGQIHFRRHGMAILTGRRRSPFGTGLAMTDETIEGSIDRLGGMLGFQQPIISHRMGHPAPASRAIIIEGESQP